MNKLDSITMRDLLPPNFKHDPDAIAASAAVAPDYHRLYALAGQAVVLANIGNLAEEWLDLLAADMHVDYYDITLPIEKKQELVRQSIPMHRKKGTPWAVEELIRIVFGEGHVEEWFEYGGEPYYFRVYSTNKLATPEDARKFRVALESVKNLRSALEGIYVLRTWYEVLLPHTWDEHTGGNWESAAEKQWSGINGENVWADTIDGKPWSRYKDQSWGEFSALDWQDILGKRTWGQVYNYVWEGTL